MKLIPNCLMLLTALACANAAPVDTDEIAARDEDGSDTSEDTAASPHYDYANDSPILINEVVASNQFGHSDELDEFDDWLELYNTSSVAVDVSGWGLTDNYSKGIVYQFPEASILPANGFLLIWCDGSPEQGPLHAGFKIAKSGETITLLNAESLIADEVTTPTLAADISYGRRQDGGMTWDFFSTPTPGASNSN